MRNKIILFCVCLLACACTAPAQVCSNFDESGTYQVVCRGSIAMPANPQNPNSALIFVPMVGVGIERCDRDGNCDGVNVNSIGGQIVRQHLIGQCRPKEDCTGTVTYSLKLIVPDPNNPGKTIEIDPATVGQPNTMHVELVISGLAAPNAWNGMLRQVTGFTGMATDAGSIIICELKRIGD